MTNPPDKFPGPIADELPTDERGVSRTSVWEQYGDQGDYSVGREWEAIYAVGDTRVEVITWIEDLRLLHNLDEDDPEWAEFEIPFSIMETTRTYTVRIDPLYPDEEITNDDDDYQFELACALGFSDLEDAEREARRLAVQDWRMAIRT